LNRNAAIEGFERFAHTYGRYNEVQKKVIKRYIDTLKNRVVDLGCGSEGLCKYREFEFYLGVDISKKMLRLNPCRWIMADFNTKECYEKIRKYDFEQIVSFSALQWAGDLSFVFEQIKSLEKEYLLAVFTSSTFKTLHKFLDVSSPIPSKKEILKAAELLKPKKIEVLNYEMCFDSPKEMLEYIKFSGVKGGIGAKRGKIKKFLKEFPHDFLEFEIVVLMG